MAVDALHPSNTTLVASGTAARARLRPLPAPAQGRVAVAAVAVTAAAAAAAAALAHTQVLGVHQGIVDSPSDIEESKHTHGTDQRHGVLWCASCGELCIE